MDDKTKSLLEQLHAPDADTRTQGLLGIWKLPKFAQAELAPEFVRLLREGNEQAARGLRFLGEYAGRVLPQLIEALDDSDLHVRILATSVLCEMPNVAADAVPTLIGMMREDDAAIRSAAIRAAGRILTPVEGLVSELVGCLRDEHPTVRSLAASALGRLGIAARDAVPALISALDDSYEPTRILALQSLEKIGDVQKDLITPITKRLYDPYPTVVSEAAGILVRAGKAATTGLIAALESKQRYPIIGVLDALARFGKDFGEISPTIIPLLTHPKPVVRQAAISAYYKLSPNDAPPKLLDALKDDNLMVRQRAASYLKNFRLPDSIKLLTETLHDTYFDYFARTCLMETIAITETDEGNNALIEFLREGQLYDNRCAAADAIRSLTVTEAIPTLVENLSDESPKIRHHAIMALERFAAPETISALVLRLRDEDRHIRDWAEKTLIKIGAPAVSHMIPLLLDAQKQSTAKRILIQIGTPEALHSVENL